VTWIDRPPLRRAPVLILAVGAVAALLLLASRASFVPLWDGRIYADCGLTVAREGFRPYSLRCGGHSSIAYSMLFGIAYRLVPDTPITSVAVSALMLAGGAVAFHRLLRVAFPSPDLAVERAALTGAFLVQPSFLAMVVQPNLDLPVLVGMLWCLVTLIERRWVWTVLIGTATIFSKETGLLLYGVLVACYGLWRIVAEGGSLGRRARTAISLLPLAIPIAAFGAYVAAFVILRPNVEVLWPGYKESGGSLSSQVVVPRFNVGTSANALMIFVLNFSWIPAAFVLADGATGLVRWFRRQSHRNVPGVDHAILAVVTLVAALFTYCLTRFATFSNVRYVGVAIALLGILFLAALIRLQLATPVRRAVLGTYGVLLLVSCLWTVDPLSRTVFGTFPVGSHRMLDLTRLTDECCQTYGRDQLAYSLEFTVFDELTNAALAAAGATDSTVIVLPYHGDWFTIGPIERVSRRRTLRRNDVAVPRVVEIDALLRRNTSSPRAAWYFAFPNNEATADLARLRTQYDVGPGRPLSRLGGYTMAIYPLALRAP